MSETKIDTFVSGLESLLRYAAEHGFDHVIIDTSDYGETIGIGLHAADGTKHGVCIYDQDAMAWEKILKPASNTP